MTFLPDTRHVDATAAKPLPALRSSSHARHDMTVQRGSRQVQITPKYGQAPRGRRRALPVVRCAGCADGDRAGRHFRRPRRDGGRRCRRPGLVAGAGRTGRGDRSGSLPGAGDRLAHARRAGCRCRIHRGPGRRAGRVAAVAGCRRRHMRSSVPPMARWWAWRLPRGTRAASSAWCCWPVRIGRTR